MVWCQRGRGVIFNPKIYVADFGNFKQGFLSIKLIKRRVISGFRVCFFSTIGLILTDINWYFLAYASLRKCDHTHYKKFAIYFSKNKRGQRPFWIFPKIHPSWKRNPSLSDALSKSASPLPRPWFIALLGTGGCPFSFDLLRTGSRPEWHNTYFLISGVNNLGNNLIFFKF